jgi:hypothetical protein
MILLGLAAVIFGALAGAGAEIILLGLYILLGLLYFFPSLHLYRYARRISELEETPHVERLEAALEAQRSFWRFVGILMAIVLVAYALLLIVMLGIALVGTALR